VVFAYARLPACIHGGGHVADRQDAYATLRAPSIDRIISARIADTVRHKPGDGFLRVRYWKCYG
jgi:hypothetical protein